MRSTSQVLADATKGCIKQILSMPNLPSIDDAVSKLMATTIDEFKAENAGRSKEEKLRIPTELSNAQLAELI